MGKKVARRLGELLAGHKDEGGEFGTFPCPTSKEFPPQKIANAAKMGIFRNLLAEILVFGRNG
jgi:hypothetical protein